MDFYDENEEERLRNRANSEFSKQQFSNENQQIFNYLKKEILPDSKISDKTLENGVTYKNIPFLGGRPERDTVINGDDVANLNIAVNTAETFEKFLDLV